MTLTRLLATGVCLLVSMSAHAQVYEWRDASGQVMYSDRPPPGVDARVVRGTTQRLTPPAPAPAAAAPAPAAQKTLADRALEFRQRREADAAAEAERKQLASQETEKDAACTQSRSHLTALESGARISRYNSKGEREFLSDQERATEIERTRKQLEQHCK